ncbi:MAG: hypothetical protein CK604_02170 [Curvibacter sp. PD_MW3]|nr:MAG: hypothetical protein CK604_02170 [Curvibacter sp. PD_MW3]
MFGIGRGFCGRRVPIKLAIFTPDRLGQYGDEAASKPYGVIYCTKESFNDATDLEAARMRVGNWMAESDPYQ